MYDFCHTCCFQCIKKLPSIPLQASSPLRQARPFIQKPRKSLNGFTFGLFIHRVYISIHVCENSILETCPVLLILSLFHIPENPVFTTISRLDISLNKSIILRSKLTKQPCGYSSLCSTRPVSAISLSYFCPLSKKGTFPQRA